ncbi:restriction endonuclease subunit S [bacterium]|nr:restriction endonuclease subunit S [bacterium]
MTASLNRKLKAVKWGNFKIENLFDSCSGNFDIQKRHINGKGTPVITAGVANYGILGQTDISARIFPAGTITIDMFGNAFYRNEEYKMVTHARVFSLIPKFSLSYKTGLFIASSLNFIHYEFGYDTMCTWEKIKSQSIFLPINTDGTIDFDFMSKYVAELEAERVAELEAERVAELEAYLKVSSLDNYKLSIEEEQAIAAYKSDRWGIFNLKDLYGESTRGKRLKSEDRIPGDLPFVTAGESEEGVSAFIDNKVEIFSKNTTTIDMFGSAKYRNYKYGGDDHIAVVHTEKIPTKAAIFVTSACHKAAHTGKFDYGHNFYAKDADALDISLLTKRGKPDYKKMETLISAVQKIVIKDIVLYAERKISNIKKVIVRNNKKTKV